MFLFFEMKDVLKYGKIPFSILHSSYNDYEPVCKSTSLLTNPPQTKPLPPNQTPDPTSFPD